MFESDIIWMEVLTQLSIVFPFCYLMGKSVGYRTVCGKIPGWIPVAFSYTAWNLYNVIVVYCPEIWSGILSVSAAYRIRAVWGLGAMFIVIPCFYKGTIVERYFSCFVIEVISLASGIIRYICIMMARSNGLYGWLERNNMLLFTFRLSVELVPYFLFYFIFKKQFQNYHASVSRHKKICCVAITADIVMESITAFITLSKDFQTIWRGIGGTIYFFVIAGIVIVLLRRKNEKIYLQKQLLESHYQSVKNQQEKISGIQLEIGKLIASAEALEKCAESGETDLNGYADELKKLHSQLQYEEYCDNLMLDALLHNKSKECQEKEIQLEIAMRDFQSGKLADIDLFEVLSQMFGISIRQTTRQKDEKEKTIRIIGKNLSGQAVIEMQYRSASQENRKEIRDAKREYRILERKIKMLKGQCIFKVEENVEKMIVGIPCV